jgi:hypothetical protein
MFGELWAGTAAGAEQSGPFGLSIAPSSPSRVAEMSSWVLRRRRMLFVFHSCNHVCACPVCVHPLAASADDLKAITYDLWAISQNITVAVPITVLWPCYTLGVNTKVGLLGQRRHAPPAFQRSSSSSQLRQCVRNVHKASVANSPICHVRSSPCGAGALSPTKTASSVLTRSV